MSTENATDVSNNITTASPDEIAAMVRADIAVGTLSPVGWLPPVRELNTVMLIAAKLGRGKMTPEERLHKMLAGRELGIPAIAAMDQLDLIQGKISLPSYMMKARAEARGVRFKKIIHTHEECVMEATRSYPDGHIETAEATWTLDRAKTAGLLGKDVWKRDPRAQLQWRCVAELVRWIASDAMQGCCAYSQEEMGGDDDGGDELIDVDFKTGDTSGGLGSGPAFAGWVPSKSAENSPTTAPVENAAEGGPPGNGAVEHGGGGTEHSVVVGSTVTQVQVTPVVATTLPPVADVTPPAMATPEQIAQAQQYIKAGVLTVEQWKQAVSLFGVKSIKELRTETADKLLERVARWSMRQGSPPWEPETAAVVGGDSGSEGGAATDPKAGAVAGAVEPTTELAPAAG